MPCLNEERYMKVVLASKNKHKLVEISQITEKFDIQLVLESDLGVDIDVEETGSTFEENSFLKANAVMQATGLPALADDSGIAVDALNGEPGIYSARYGFDESLDDAGRVQLLLKNMKDVPDDKRQAKFVCVITLVTPDGKSIQARGEVHGFVPRRRRRLWLRSHFLLSAIRKDLGPGSPGGEKPGVPPGRGVEDFLYKTKGGRLC